MVALSSGGHTPALTCHGFGVTHGISGHSLLARSSHLAPTYSRKARKCGEAHGYLVGNEGLCFITKTGDPGLILHFGDSC